jgi:hypothetical protein
MQPSPFNAFSCPPFFGRGKQADVAFFAWHHSATPASCTHACLYYYIACADTESLFSRRNRGKNKYINLKKCDCEASSRARIHNASFLEIMLTIIHHDWYHRLQSSARYAHAYAQNQSLLAEK